MSIAERIYETVKNMPEAQAAEVLDSAESANTFRRTKTHSPLFSTGPGA